MSRDPARLGGGQPRGERVAERRVEEQPDDGEVEVGVREARVAPVEHAGQPPAARVVQHVLRLEVGVGQDREGRVVEALPQRLDAARVRGAEAAAVPAVQLALPEWPKPWWGRRRAPAARAASGGTRRSASSTAARSSSARSRARSGSAASAATLAGAPPSIR